MLPYLTASQPSRAAAANDHSVDIHSLGGSCSDTRSRTQNRASTPWCNLSEAGKQAIAGDVVTVRRGTYTKVQTGTNSFDVFVLQVMNSGTSSAPIIFRANPGENVVISGAGGTDHGIGVNQVRNVGTQPKYIVIDGFEVRDFGTKGFCAWVRSTSDVTLRNLDVHGCRLGAVEMHDTARVTLENSRIHDNPMGGYTSAVDLYRCRAGNVVRNNHIWNNTDTDSNNSEAHGVIMDVCKDYGGSAIIENNVISNNEGWCIAMFWSDRSTIRNNKCYQNGNRRSDTGELSVGNENHRVHNNDVVPRSGRLGINLKYVTSNVVEYN
jgi:parallel beta-helix repeat protein